MGKVLARFLNGRPGTVSRSKDDIIISLRNVGTADIPFGAPVFFNISINGAEPFNTSSPQDATDFLGFAVRVPDKTPETLGGNPWSAPQEGVWKAGDEIEVLVRGSIVIAEVAQASKGSALYIRKSDGKITTNPGSAGTTIQLPNMVANGVRDANGTVEAVILERNRL